ncbi:MAG: hypothetical protein KKF20_05605, partial [Bacteroidetes bacterium]|nr:hypothetical protein [Bacteroidota bacterium]
MRTKVRTTVAFVRLRVMFFLSLAFYNTKSTKVIAKSETRRTTEVKSRDHLSTSSRKKHGTLLRM